MGSGPVTSDTAPPPNQEVAASTGEVNRRLEAGGPLGFIMAVHETLEQFDRPYFYSASVPPWLLSRESDGESEQDPSDFQQEYADFEEGGVPKRDLKTVPHCVIHQWRKYPAKRRFSGTNDSPTGARRQKKPDQIIYHDRPLPSDPDQEDVQERSETVSNTFAREDPKAPLWDSKEQVPDLIRDHVDEGTQMYVTPWVYDVFVDFVLVAENLYLLEQMETDIEMILRTFHDRSTVGASNLAGWFYQSVPGSPPEVSDQMRGDYPARTITWRLQQTEAYAFPIAELNQIRVELYGDTPLA